MVKTGAFCVDILNDEQQAVSAAFACPREDKFAGVFWHVDAAGSPMIDGSLGWVEHALGAVHDAGDHELVT